MINTIAMGCQHNDGGYKSLNVDSFEQTINSNDNIIVLDSRTEQEYNDGHLRNAVNIDVMKEDFEEKALSTLDKNKTIAVYCRSGRRSKNAAKILVANGYNVVELD
ncbi:MAG: rhodanese-like domain-containing protein, partial [Bacteroidales bacterium]|nr:rhodanese-like domain-containing protein [Bacteroidales bacterium]